MESKTTRKSFILLIMVFIMVTAACAVPPPTEPATLSNPTSVVNTNTPLATATYTATATATATATMTPTNRPPKELLPTLTFTPAPTQTPTGVYTGGLIWPRAHFSEANVSWRTTNCANPGKNLSCEIEYRKDSSNCYVGMSCYDDCGWYYSVNTIPAGVEEFSLPCW